MGAPVPVEEYIFYFTGFLCVLLIYVWLDEFWLVAYNVPDYPGEAKKISRLLQFHPTSAIVGVLLILMAIVYKKMFSPVPDGFPGYFTVLVVGAFSSCNELLSDRPAIYQLASLQPDAFHCRAGKFAVGGHAGRALQVVGFSDAQMTGLFIGAWARLPIEEVGVWIAVTYATVIVFEVFKLWQASGKKAKHAFLGKK